MCSLLTKHEINKRLGRAKHDMTTWLEGWTKLKQTHKQWVSWTMLDKWQW